MVANCAVVGWDKKTRELTKKKAIRKQQARVRGEETGSEDDDDDGESDKAAAGVDWGDLEDEDSLSTQGPFPFHTGGSESTGTVEPGLPLGLVGAGGSTVTLGVPTEDRWTGGDGSETVPVGDIPPGTTRWYMGRTIRGGPARKIKACTSRL